MKMSPYQYRDAMSKTRWSCDHLIFNMGIPIPGKDGLYWSGVLVLHIWCCHPSQALHWRACCRGRRTLLTQIAQGKAMKVICAVIGSQMLSDEQHLWVSIYRKAVPRSVIITHCQPSVDSSRQYSLKNNCHKCNVLESWGPSWYKDVVLPV